MQVFSILTGVEGCWRHIDDLAGVVNKGQTDHKLINGVHNLNLGYRIIRNNEIKVNNQTSLSLQIKKQNSNDDSYEIKYYNIQIQIIITYFLNFWWASSNIHDNLYVWKRINAYVCYKLDITKYNNSKILHSC